MSLVYNRYTAFYSIKHPTLNKQPPQLTTHPTGRKVNKCPASNKQAHTPLPAPTKKENDLTDHELEIVIEKVLLEDQMFLVF